MGDSGQELAVDKTPSALKATAGSRATPKARGLKPGGLWGVGEMGLKEERAERLTLPGVGKIVSPGKDALKSRSSLPLKVAISGYLD